MWWHQTPAQYSMLNSGVLILTEFSEEKLEAGGAAWREEIKTVKAHASSQYNAGWHEALDLESMAIVSQAVAMTAKERKESRGAHSRADHELEDKEFWGKRNLIIKKGADGAMELSHYERPDPPEHLAKVAYATVEELDAMVASGEVKI